jgi:hypothetical protein
LFQRGEIGRPSPTRANFENKRDFNLSKRLPVPFFPFARDKLPEFSVCAENAD